MIKLVVVISLEVITFLIQLRIEYLSLAFYIGKRLRKGMLKFFRQIRRNLFSQNKTSSYFLYALGEILLVVVGILIALQINNWNEQKQLDKAIIAGLKEVREDLVKDTIRLSSIIQAKKLDLEAQKRVINVLQGEVQVSDQFYRDLGRVLLWRETTILSNGFDLIKEIGLNNLNDKELRNQLVALYGEGHDVVLGEFEDDEQEFKEMLLPYIRHHFKDWKYGQKGIPHSVDALLNDAYFLTSMIMALGNVQKTIAACEAYVLVSGSLIIMIDEKITQ